MENKKGSISYILAAVSCIMLVFADQYTKQLAVRHLSDGPTDLISGVFQLRYLENRGAAFGMLQGRRMLFLLIAAVISLIICYVYVKTPADRRYRLLRAVLVLLQAGAIGNTIDRVSQGYVVDFLYIQLIDFPIFNVADCYVSCSAVILIFLLLFYYKDEELEFLTRKKKEPIV